MILGAKHLRDGGRGQRPGSRVVGATALDKGRQNAILDLALQFENSCTTKDNLRNAYEKCNDISQESRALIDSFLKEGSDKDYELNLSITHVEPSPYIPNSVTIIPGPAGIVQISSSTRVEPSPSTLNPVRIIPGPAGLVQQARLLKENIFILDPDGALMSTQQYMDKVVNSTNYANAFCGTVTGCLGDVDNFLKKRKLEQVVAMVKSCSHNMLDDLNVTLKDLSGTIPGTIHRKVIGEGGYKNDITVGAAMILANVSVFTPKPSQHYLNITMRNVVEVFRKDTVPESGSG
ncbi:EEIG1/EHBP1 N-terminal domain-containing protein [Tanacetum coccineum]